MRMLDVAIGTGLLAREAVRILGRPDDVIGLDLSEGMLAEARRALPIPLVQAQAETLPLADASLDFVSMSYALRHVTSLGVLFAEFRRVSAPAGGCWCWSWRAPRAGGLRRRPRLARRRGAGAERADRPRVAPP
jgi:ubiquinone/menaquinone biosynthesis C-methylase UbiE